MSQPKIIDAVGRNTCGLGLRGGWVAAGIENEVPALRTFYESVECVSQKNWNKQALPGSLTPPDVTIGELCSSVGESSSPATWGRNSSRSQSLGGKNERRPAGSGRWLSG